MRQITGIKLKKRGRFATVIGISMALLGESLTQAIAIGKSMEQLAESLRA